MKNGFTTTILHSDLESPIEHFSVHKLMHMSRSLSRRAGSGKGVQGEMRVTLYGR